jgi:hypothetical protein
MPIQVSNGGTSKGIGNLNSALRKDRQITKTKAYRQSVSLMGATNIISQLFAFTGRNMLISLKSLWRLFKNSKITLDAY